MPILPPEGPERDAAAKTCCKCGQAKGPSEFHRDARRADGLFPWCKRCRRKDPLAYDAATRLKAEGLKRCCACRSELAPTMFYANPSQPDGLHSQCKPCSRESALRYARANPERTRAKESRRRTGDNLAKAQERWRVYYQKHQERLRLASLDYSKTPAGKAVQARANHGRRVRVKATANDLTHRQWLAIIAAQNNHCLACDREFGPALKPTRDHVVPVSKGGGLTAANVVALCQSCNSKKHDRHIEYRRPKSQATLF